jgi:hypothetical protein
MPRSMKRNYSCFLLALLCISATALAHAAECRYIPLNRQQGLSMQGECGKLTGEDGFRIFPSHLKKMSFTEGLAEVFVNDKVFYVSKSGKAVHIYLFDNGADYFSEGLARTISGGKFGFVDNRLNLIIKPKYDFAFPFKKGVAVVCNECRPVSEGEHRLMAEGRWGVINKSGRIVIPMEYSREELEKKLSK